ncbi:adenylate kinase [soil metagenome]
MQESRLNPTFPPKHLVVFGRPGSGKSSLAEQLASDHGFRMVRTGELLRSAIRRGDALGAEVDSILASGNLVPDLMVYELLERDLKAPVSEKLLFDGFPRTFGQVPLLERLEKRMGFVVDCFLEIAVSPEEALARMTARRICPQCGAVYHLKNKPPKVADACDHDGALLTTRKDDRPEIIAVRQQVYDEHMGPVLDHYQASAFDRFRRVNGEQSFEDVYTETVRTLGFSA